MPSAGGSRPLAVIIVAAFDGPDELLQTFTPGRSGGDIFDWTADLLGAVTGALVSLLTMAASNGCSDVRESGAHSTDIDVAQR